MHRCCKDDAQILQGGGAAQWGMLDSTVVVHRGGEMLHGKMVHWGYFTPAIAGKFC